MYVFDITKSEVEQGIGRRASVEGEGVPDGHAGVFRFDRDGGEPV